jgi:hypothetical protein
VALSLKVADLYADVEIRTAKLDVQLAALQARLGKFKMPSLSASGPGSVAAQMFPVAKIQAAGNQAAAATTAAQDKIARAAERAQARAAAKNAAWQAREVARIRSEGIARARAAETAARARMTGELSLKNVEGGFSDRDDLTNLNKAQSRRRGGLGNMNLAAIGGTLDDLQYVPEMGLRPILNNIMAIAPAAGIALLALDQLRKHFTDLQFLWGGNATKTQAEQMEALRDATARTAAETAKLAKYDRERAAAKDQAETATESEAAQTKAVNEAIVNAPLENVDKHIRTLFGNDAAAGFDPKKLDEFGNNAFHIRRLQREQSADPEGFSTARQTALSSAIAANEAIEKALKVYVDNWTSEFRSKIATDPASLKLFADKLEASGRDPKLVEKLRDAQKEAREATPGGKRNKELMDSTWDAEEAALQRLHDRDEARRASKDPRFTEWNKQDQLRRSAQPEISPSGQRAFGAVQGALSRFGITLDRTAVDPDDLSKGKTLDFGLRPGAGAANLGRMALGAMTGNTMGVLGMANQMAGGSLAAAGAAIARKIADQPALHVGGSLSDLGDRIQQEIFDKRDKDVAEEQRKANGLLSELVIIAKDGLRNGRSIFGP